MLQNMSYNMRTVCYVAEYNNQACMVCVCCCQLSPAGPPPQAAAHLRAHVTKHVI
jgi:hypothetical protein